jgi:hypothetical protein
MIFANVLFVILLGTLATLVALVWGSFRASTKRRRNTCVLSLFLLVGVPVGLVGWHQRSFALSVVPDALQVSSIAYAKEESWGFGPGGNEAGVRIYPLKDAVSRDILSKGMQFFLDMPANADQNKRGWRGHYSHWTVTPAFSESGRFDMIEYVCAYGFCIDVDPSIVADVNRILNTPGSYYARGRIGMLIVSPRDNKVIYLYNG